MTGTDRMVHSAAKRRNESDCQASETISGGRMGFLPYSTSKTATNDERNLASEFTPNAWTVIPRHVSRLQVPLKIMKKIIIVYAPLAYLPV
jgi:hypothetical protein